MFKKVSVVNGFNCWLFGYSYQTTTTDTPASTTYNVKKNTTSTSFLERTLLSYYGRAILPLSNKYIINAQ